MFLLSRFISLRLWCDIDLFLGRLEGHGKFGLCVHELTTLSSDLAHFRITVFDRELRDPPIQTCLET